MVCVSGRPSDLRTSVTMNTATSLSSPRKGVRTQRNRSSWAWIVPAQPPPPSTPPPPPPPPLPHPLPPPPSHIPVERPLDRLRVEALLWRPLAWFNLSGWGWKFGLMATGEDGLSTLVITVIMIGTIWDFLQSPHCTVNRLQHVRYSGLGSIMCKPYATHWVLISATCVTCHEGTAQLLSLTELKSLYFIGWTINRWRREGNRSAWRKPLVTSFRKMPHTKALEIQAPSETRTRTIALVAGWESRCATHYKGIASNCLFPPVLRLVCVTVSSQQDRELVLVFLTRDSCCCCLVDWSVCLVLVCMFFLRCRLVQDCFGFFFCRDKWVVWSVGYC